MSAKIVKYYIASIILSFGFLNVAHASFEITEIMYDLDGTDTGREWIEVENTGSSASDLSKWYFFSDNTKHALTPQGVSMIEPGGYAIISQDINKFKLDWPNFTGSIFDSSWTGLNNDGETIAFKDSDLNIVSSVVYTSSMGANGNGDTLQKINGVWVGAHPTVGIASSSSNITSSSGGSNSTVSTPVKEKEVPKINTDIIMNNIAIAGLATQAKDHTTGYLKEVLKNGLFVWNFGDGTTKELRGSESFNHIYDYPGEYVVILSYYDNYYISNTYEPTATDRFVIKVIPSEVSIISIGTDSDPFIEIENKSSYEINISKWILKGQVHYFIIPDNTIILPSKKLKFSPRTTLFDKNDIVLVELDNPSSEMMSIYPLTIPVKEKSIIEHPVISKSSSNLNNQNKIDNSSVINLNDMSANVNGADQSSTGTFAWAGLASVIVIGIGAIITIKPKKYKDDIEDEIRARDMTIIE